MNNTERALLSVLKGPYNADVMDYLLRDTYYAGTPEFGRVNWQRPILTSSIRNNDVVLKNRSKAALESFYVSRHQRARFLPKLASSVEFAISDLVLPDMTRLQNQRLGVIALWNFLNFHRRFNSLATPYVYI